MSVVEPERHKGRLEVHVKAQVLAAYTALIVKNPKVFDPEVDEDLIKRIKSYSKVVMTADPDRLKATRRKYYRLAQKCKRGEISREKVDESYRCWRECASKGDGHRMLRNMDRYYQNLWKGWKTDAEDCKKAVPPCGGRPGESADIGTGAGTSAE